MRLFRRNPSGRAFAGPRACLNSLIWNNQTALAQAKPEPPAKAPSRPRRVVQRFPRTQPPAQTVGWSDLLAVLNTRLPIFRPTRMMRERKDNNSVGIWPIHNRKRKVLDKDSPSVFGCGRTSKRERQGACRCVLDGRRETRAKPGLFLIVVDNLEQKLAPCCRDEFGTLHRVRRRASANTFSAA